MDATTLKDKISTAEKFITKQQDKGRNVDHIITNQVNSIVNHINELSNLSMTVADELNDIIEDGPWSADQKLMMVERVLERCGDASNATNRPQQEMPAPENYLTEDDWVELDGARLATCVRVFSKMAHGVGMSTPTETTSGRIAKIIASVGIRETNPSATLLHDILNDVKAGIKSQTQGVTWTWPHIKVYPRDARDLPQDVLTHAFGANPPNICTPERRAIISLKTPKFLRSTAGALKTPTAPIQLNLNQVEQPMNAPGAINMQMFHMMQYCIQMQQSQSMWNAGNQAGPSSGSFFPQMPPPTPTPPILDRSLAGFRQRTALQNHPAQPQPTQPVRDDQQDELPVQDGQQDELPSSEDEDATDPLDEMRKNLGDALVASTAEKAVAAASKKAAKKAAREAGLEADVGPAKKKSKSSQVRALARGTNDVDTPLKKKPAAAPMIAACKKPAAAPMIAAPIGRPAIPRSTAAMPAPPTHYLGCKISVSHKKAAYRVFLDLTQKNPVDKSVKWSINGEKAAWALACEMIENQVK